MNLVIDQGNTVCKLALFDAAFEPVQVMHVEQLDEAYVLDVLRTYAPERCIVSSVQSVSENLLHLLRSNVDFFEMLTSKTRLPISNAYATPDTLGVDRLAAAVGAWTLAGGKPLLVVDMGTAITYDFVDRDGCFRGGNIAPGVNMRFRALYQATHRLPLIQPEVDFDAFGKDTSSAIQAGVMQGVLHEVEGYQRLYTQFQGELLTFLTGGDRIYFEDKLKSSIFVNKNLLLIGLNRILIHNVST